MFRLAQWEELSPSAEGKGTDASHTHDHRTRKGICGSRYALPKVIYMDGDHIRINLAVSGRTIVPDPRTDLTYFH